MFINSLQTGKSAMETAINGMETYKKQYMVWKQIYMETETANVYYSKCLINIYIW